MKPRTVKMQRLHCCDTIRYNQNPWYANVELAPLPKAKMQTMNLAKYQIVSHLYYTTSKGLAQVKNQ